jgi:AraC-like DNA-binding protein
MAFWLDTVCTQILPVSIDPRTDAAPVAAMSCARIGEMSIRSVVGGDHVYVRDAREIRSGDPDTLQIGLPLGGKSMLIQDGREAVLNPGDMVVYDSSRPFTLAMDERFQWQVFLFPKSTLRRSDRELQEITAIPIRGERGLNGVVGRFLRGVAREAAELERTPDAAILGRHAADLTATMIRSVFGSAWDVNDADMVLREQIEQFIQARHADAALDPPSIARAHSVSLRRLHAVFEGTGRTVMDVVRDVRLSAIHADLTDLRLRHVHIADIAASHGIHSATTLARLVHAAYGTSPRALREHAAPAEDDR